MATVERQAKDTPMLIEMLMVGLIEHPEAKIGYRVVNRCYYEFQIYKDDGDKMSQWNSLINIKANPRVTLEEVLLLLLTKSIRQIGGKYINFNKKPETKKPLATKKIGGKNVIIRE